MTLEFDDIPPAIAPMPPVEHCISASTIMEMFQKLEHWLRKHGYELYTR